MLLGVEIKVNVSEGTIVALNLDYSLVEFHTEYVSALLRPRQNLSRLSNSLFAS